MPVRLSMLNACQNMEEFASSKDPTCSDHHRSMSSGIDCKKFEVSSNQGNRALILFSGFGLTCNSQLVDVLCKALAKESGVVTYAVSTTKSHMKERNISQDLLSREAEEVCAFIAARSIAEVVLVGHSNGAKKAIAVAHFLKNQTAINVFGLILLNPIGFLAHARLSLTLNFIFHSTFGVLFEIIRNRDAARLSLLVLRGLLVAIFHMILELMRFGSRSVSSVIAEITEISKKNPYIAAIDSPVIIITGRFDTVSDVFFLKKTDTSRRLSPSLITRLGLDRSPYVRLVTARKLGSHALPFLRATIVAKVSLYLLVRFCRRENVNKTALSLKDL
jgi:pimeloyl-ACP methyl ester carboxylesterase